MEKKTKKLNRMKLDDLAQVKVRLEQKQKVTVKSKPKTKRKPLERTYHVDHTGSVYYKHVCEKIKEKQNRGIL